jgi:acetylglutamate kinase
VYAEKLILLTDQSGILDKDKNLISSLNKKTITLELAKQMIDKFVKNTSREPLTDLRPSYTGT